MPFLFVGPMGVVDSRVSDFAITHQFLFFEFLFGPRESSTPRICNYASISFLQVFVWPMVIVDSPHLHLRINAMLFLCSYFCWALGSRRLPRFPCSRADILCLIFVGPMGVLDSRVSDLGDVCVPRQKWKGVQQDLCATPVFPKRMGVQRVYNTQSGICVQRPKMFEERNRLKLVLACQDPSVFNALAKIYVDSNTNPKQFLKENNVRFATFCLGRLTDIHIALRASSCWKFCEVRDPYIAYAKVFAMMSSSLLPTITIFPCSSNNLVIS